MIPQEVESPLLLRIVQQFKDVESELKLSSKGKVLNVSHAVEKEASEDVSEPEAQFEVTLKVYVVLGLRPVMV